MTFVLFLSVVEIASAHEISVADYPSIHEAGAANPGRWLYVPSGNIFHPGTAGVLSVEILPPD